MPETLIKVDLTQVALREREDPQPLASRTSRWRAGSSPGDEFVLETFDWTGGFIKNNDSADDVRDIDLTTVHYLSRPGRA